MTALVAFRLAGTVPPDVVAALTITRRVRARTPLNEVVEIIVKLAMAAAGVLALRDGGMAAKWANFDAETVSFFRAASIRVPAPTPRTHRRR